MAALSTGDRALVHAIWMRENDIQWGTVTKADLRAAVDAVDAWCETNAASLNTAIPQPARTQLTTKQKAWLLLHVVRKRLEVSA